jgi:hypothetical protein
MQQYQDLKLNPSKIRTALHVSAYSAITRCVEIRGNCCAFHANAIEVFVFTMLSNEVSVVPPPMPHVSSFLVCLLCIKRAVCGRHSSSPEFSALEKGRVGQN